MLSLKYKNSSDKRKQKQVVVIFPSDECCKTLLRFICISHQAQFHIERINSRKDCDRHETWLYPKCLNENYRRYLSLMWLKLNGWRWWDVLDIFDCRLYFRTIKVEWLKTGTNIASWTSFGFWQFPYQSLRWVFSNREVTSDSVGEIKKQQFGSFIFKEIKSGFDCEIYQRVDWPFTSRCSANFQTQKLWKMQKY